MRQPAAILLALGATVLGACGGPMRGTEGVLEPIEGVGPGAGPAMEVSRAFEPPAVLTAAEWGQGSAIAMAGPVYTDPGELPRLQVAGEERSLLPLEHTSVRARLTGLIAEVEVRQTYGNPNAEPIEAVYVFPLPENSAVNHMRMEIGDRVVEAEIQRREEARRIYESARREGYTAALLEQERPNVFTQSVANIAPGERIDVVIRYVQDLTYDAGVYEFVFPMVVGPRFVPGRDLPGPQAGAGVGADTDAVPDASRITPPVVGRGERSGHDISVEVEVEGALPLGEIAVPTHEVQASRDEAGNYHVTLAEAASIPNRDFVLRYRVAGDEPRATLYLSGGEEGYFTLAMHPPALDVDQLVGQREIIFVVDVSGSMSGLPLSLSRTAMREALQWLRPVDTFNIITFSGATGTAFPVPVPANDGNLRQAFEYVDQMVAGGGTYMANAVEAALSPDVEGGRSRSVFFMTDGFVGNEDEIIGATERFVAALEARQGQARVFGFGVGSSTNRYLLDGLSRAGRGLSVYVTAREHPARAVNQFFRYIDRSVLQDVAVDWADLGPDEVMPRELPDLFASHAFVLHGRYARPPSGAIAIRGRAGDREVRVPVTVAAAEVEGEPTTVLGTLWARSRVDELEEDRRQGMDVTEEIARLGLEHHMVTAFTSFVAVDLSRRVGQGDPRQVVQPVEVPEGVDGEMAGAVPATREPEEELSYEEDEAPPAGGPPVMAEQAMRTESMDYAESGSAGGAESSAEPCAAPPEARYRHGCHCRAAGAPTASDLLPFLVAALALALARRRGRRRG